MKAKNFLFILAVAVFSNCANESNNKETKSATTNLQQTIYYGGDIITMEGDNPQYVEAVIEREGKIIYAGPKASAVNNFAGKTIEIDLKGKTMLPGFVDPHGHFMSAVLMVTQVNCASPPMGDVTDIPSVIKKLQEFKDSNSIKDGEWIVGWGYDQDLLAEKRHITKMDLDKAFPNNKVLIIHISMHGGVLNSKALEWAELDETSETPEGGVIARIPGTNEPAGLLMEMAYMPVFDKLPQPSEDEMMELMEAAQMQYTSNGYTHAIEGFTHIKDMNTLKRAAKEGRFFIDIASLPGFTEMDKWLNNPEYPFGEYNNHLKFQGGKFTLDGSPQGLTAYMVDPFFVMWTSMKRETRSGKILGADQRIDAYAALQQITTGPAYQFFEENRKGMIKKGLLADFVILDKNPLKLGDVDEMREITILETIKEGNTVFKEKTVDPIKGYFAKNTIVFDENYDFKHLVVDNQADFVKYFGVSKTMKNKVDIVDFEQNSIIAVVTKPSKNTKKLDLIYEEFHDNELYIQYSIRLGDKTSFESTGLLLATIPKGISKIEFRSQGSVDVWTK